MIYEIIIKIFPNTIKRVKAINTINNINYIASGLRNLCDTMNWKSDNDINITLYAEELEKRLEMLKKVAQQSIK